MAGSLASINVRFEVNTTDFSKQMQNIARDAKKMGDQLQAAGKSMSLYLTAPIAAAGAAMIKLSSDFNESANKVDVAFKESANSVEAFADTTLEKFGIAEGSALDMAALFGDMATSMGISEKAAAGMSTSLVGLAGDLASFKNIGIAQATTALNGVFTGETESLKMLGIVMTEANLAQFALSQGITKSIKDFTQAEKVQLRYAYVMAQTTNAQGDFARTGGGAANQMRVFQEGLKELGAQLGQIILPLFTELVKGLNDVIVQFKGLDPEMQQFLVVTAGIAAAIGPVLVGLGGILKIIPAMVSGINALKAAMGFLSANFIAIAAVLTTAFLVYKTFQGETVKLTEAQQTLNTVNEEAVRLVSSQRAEVDKLVKAAKDETISVKERREAVAQLNALAPEYLGNLTLETINTEKATAAIQKYNTALLDAAKAKAADTLLNNNLVKQAAAYAKYEIKIQQNAAKQEEVLFGKERANLQQVAKLGYESSRARLAAKKELEATLAPLQREESILKRVYDQFKGQLGVLDSGAAAASKYTAELSKIGGSSEREKVKAIDLPEAKSIGTTDAIDRQIAKLQELQTNVALNSQEFRLLQKQIDALETQKKIIIDPTQLIKVGEVMEQVNLKTSETVQRLQVMQGLMQGVAQGLGDAFANLSNRFVDSLNLAESGFQGFAKNMISTITQLVSMMLAQSLSQAIAGATSSGAATGPAAVVTTPAFIATAVSGVLAAFAAIPKFETGGIVGGSNYYGDKILARLNSGELILNRDQQQNLFNMLNPSLSASDFANGYIAETKISGEDIDIVLKRFNNKKGRKS